ncbi:MAG: hypothetical protein E7574_05065 [Ruminococcaceae bacterium]|nr:hypothetical protein [Oscillospiraceae bacterium]
MNFNVIGNKYFEYTSPDKEHVIVVDIESSSDLHSDFYSGDIYEKTSFCTMKKVGWFSKPSNCGDYYYVWNEENFEIHFECETDHDHDTIMLEYPITIEYTK